MSFQFFWIIFFCVFPQYFSEEIQDVKVTIRGSTTIAKTDDSFICATLDWWPPEKCNYNQCPWGQSSVLNLNLTHPILLKSVQAFDVLRIRVGGSLQDQVVYGVPNLSYLCQPFSKKAGDLFGFSEGCLSMERWDKLNIFFQRTGSVATFGLNALYGRNHVHGSTWIGDWNSSNTRDFIEHTIKKGYPVDSWEFGDDPHIEDKIMDPRYLSRIEGTFRNLQLTLKRHGPWASAWVGEAGGAYNSGSHRVSNKFLNSFWYLDQLGMASKYDSKSYCRQTLIGGNYGLLDTNNFIPNPDYYSALLWHRLMGKGVLSTYVTGSSMLRAYAHCRKGKTGITVLLINLSRSIQFNVRVQDDLSSIRAEQEEGMRNNDLFFSGFWKTTSWFGRNALPETREEYHLTGKDGNHLSQIMLLNGTPLQLTEDGDIPSLDPVLVPVDSPVSLAPLSIAFVVFPTFEAGACI